MRKQIAAANWKMNLTYQSAERLLNEILSSDVKPVDGQQVIFAVPFPYLIMANSEVADEKGFSIAAQNCYHKNAGAYTGEVSAEMLHSVGIKYCIIGHSERRQYFEESAELLSEKIDILFEHDITPIFCCGEALNIREGGGQNAYVQEQLEASLFHLSPTDITRTIIAYEPIWAIGTGKTASTAQAQEMHQHLRSVIAGKYGEEVANEVTILYGGSVKGANAAEIFGSPDVDGGLVGGASLSAPEFLQIIKALKTSA